MATEEIEAAAETTEVTATEAEATIELTDEEAFDAAFDEATLVLDDDTITGDADDEKSGATDAEGAATGVSGDADGDTDSNTDIDGDGTDDGSGTTGSAGGGDATTGDEDRSTESKATADAPTAREIALQEQIDALKAAAPVVEKPSVHVVEEPAATEVKPILTVDETAKVAAYKEEWGDVAEAEALIRKEENQVIVGYIFDQVKEVIAPLLKSHENRNGRDQYDDLVSLVPDYDEVRDKAVAWVDTLPEGISKRIYSEVTKTGTPEEVAAMIRTFKLETKYATKETESKPATITVQAQTAASGGATKKPNTASAASLKVVKTVRSKDTTAGPDMNDFEGSFDEFAVTK